MSNSNLKKSDQPILQIRNMKKHFNLGNGKILKAVDNFSIEIKRGETFGLVGESGCGKSIPR